MDEIDLIKGCRENNRQCQKVLYERYSALMFAVCRRYCPDYEIARDVLQEGFLKVFLNIDKFKNEGSFEGWIKRIMINSALGYLRSVSVRFVDGDGTALPEKTKSPDVIDDLSAKDIMKLIQQLPAGYRTVFNLHAIEGYDYRDIALMLNITEATARSQYLKARLAIQQLMKKYNPITKD
jgi:RNA polymerase sigma factor (sigma-70 family)